MPLNSLRNSSNALKVFIVIFSIGFLPSVIYSILDLLFLSDLNIDDLELFTTKSKELAETVVQDNKVDHVGLFKGIRELIIEIPAELLDTYFYVGSIGNSTAYLLIGVLLTYVLFKEKFRAIVFDNKTPMLFFASIFMALNVPVIASDALGLNEFLGMDDLQMYLFNTDVLSDTIISIQQYTPFFPNENRWYFVCWIGIALLPAVGEELLFRGVLMKLLTNKLGNVHNSIAVTSLIFALAHFNLTNFFYYFILAVILGYMYHWGRNLLFPIILHLINNTSVLWQYFAFGANSEEDIQNAMEDGTPTGIMSYITIALILLMFHMNYKRYQESQQLKS